MYSSMRVILPSLQSPTIADPQRASVAAVLHAVQRVLNDEPAGKRIDGAVVVRASALHLVARRQRREVVFTRHFAAAEHCQTTQSGAYISASSSTRRS
jgi:hypothetical protein